MSHNAVILDMRIKLSCPTSWNHKVRWLIEAVDADHVQITEYATNDTCDHGPFGLGTLANEEAAKRMNVHSIQPIRDIMTPYG